MYKISTSENHVLVKFEEDFGYNDIRAILQHETRQPEYARMHDIWLIGKHHAQIRLGELLSIIDDFPCHCPNNAERKKIAMVVDQGLTEAIVLLLAKGLNRKLPFECKIFHTLDEAEEWLGVAESIVA